VVFPKRFVLPLVFRTAAGRLQVYERYLVATLCYQGRRVGLEEGGHHLLRDPVGSAQGGHNAQSFHVSQGSFQVRIEPLHFNDGLDIITHISQQFVNFRAGNWDNSGLTLIGECPANGLARMPNREKIGVDAVVLEQDGRFGGSYCLR